MAANTCIQCESIEDQKLEARNPPAELLVKTLLYSPHLLRINLTLRPLPTPHPRQSLAPSSTASPILHLIDPRR